MTEETSQPGRRRGSKKIIRRAFLKTTAGVVAAFGAIGGARALQKATQEDVSYQDTPMDGQSCANCHFWDGEGGCDVVEGEVSADGWCDIWAAVLED